MPNRKLVPHHLRTGRCYSVQGEEMVNFLKPIDMG